MDRKSVLEVGKVLYHSGLPFRVRLFNILASSWFIISLCNGVLSYWNNGDRKLLLINTGIALLSCRTFTHTTVKNIKDATL